MAGAFIKGDLVAVFNTADFAIVADVMDATGLIKTGEVVGIFENETRDIATGDDRNAMMRQATFVCPTLVATITVGAVLRIEGVKYTVRYPDHDGTGVTEWYLEKWRT